jgi:hypothetical protein
MFEALAKYLKTKAGLDAEEIDHVLAVSIEKKIRKAHISFKKEMFAMITVSS